MPRKPKEEIEKIENKKSANTKKATKESTTTKASTAKTSSKKTATAKTSAKKDSTKTTSTKKTTTKKTTAKKTISKKDTTKKVSAKKKTEKKVLPIEYYDLPQKYNKTVVKVLAQTPKTLFVYWEISDDDRKMYKEKFGDNFFETSTPILKVHNITMNYYFEVEINDFANCWYLHVNDSKCQYEIELDRKKYIPNKEPEYIYISKSNELEAPNDHVLLEKLPDYVTFKNVKTNNTKNVKVPKNINKIFGTKEIYNMFYKDNEFINNPSSII